MQERMIFAIEVYDLGEDWQREGFRKRFKAVWRKQSEPYSRGEGDNPWEAIADLARQFSGN